MPIKEHSNLTGLSKQEVESRIKLGKVNTTQKEIRTKDNLEVKN